MADDDLFTDLSGRLPGNDGAIVYQRSTPPVDLAEIEPPERRDAFKASCMSTHLYALARQLAPATGGVAACKANSGGSGGSASAASAGESRAASN